VAHACARGGVRRGAQHAQLPLPGAFGLSLRRVSTEQQSVKTTYLLHLQSVPSAPGGRGDLKSSQLNRLRSTGAIDLSPHAHILPYAYATTLIKAFVSSIAEGRNHTRQLKKTSFVTCTYYTYGP